MQRLDLMTPKELKKLYFRSAWITQFGWVWLFFGVIIPICASVKFPIYLLFALFHLPFVWVWLFVRTKPARILFYIQAICAFIITPICLLTVSSNNGIIGGAIVCFITLWTGIEVLKSARTACLFEPDYFTHQQICQANKKRKKGEVFIDEDLKTFRPNKRISQICVVFCYIFLVLDTIGFIGIQWFKFFLTY